MKKRILVLCVLLLALGLVLAGCNRMNKNPGGHLTTTRHNNGLTTNHNNNHITTDRHTDHDFTDHTGLTDHAGLTDHNGLTTGHTDNLAGHNGTTLHPESTMR